MDKSFHQTLLRSIFHLNPLSIHDKEQFGESEAKKLQLQAQAKMYRVLVQDMPKLLQENDIAVHPS